MKPDFIKEVLPKKAENAENGKPDSIHLENGSRKQAAAASSSDQTRLEEVRRALEQNTASALPERDNFDILDFLEAFAMEQSNDAYKDQQNGRASLLAWFNDTEELLAQKTGLDKLVARLKIRFNRKPYQRTRTKEEFLNLIIDHKLAKDQSEAEVWIDVLRRKYNALNARLLTIKNPDGTVSYALSEQIWDPSVFTSKEVSI